MKLFFAFFTAAFIPTFLVSCETPFSIAVSTEAQKVQAWSNTATGQTIVAAGIAAIGLLEPQYAPLAALAARELQTGTIPTLAQAATVVQSVTGSQTAANKIATVLVAASSASAQSVSSPNAGLEAVALAIDSATK